VNSSAVENNTKCTNFKSIFLVILLPEGLVIFR